MGVLLVWAQVDDPLATYAGAAPIAVVCGVRALLPLVRGRRPGWYDAGLAAAAVASVELARLAVTAIEAAGGYHMRPINGGMGTLFPFTSWGAQLSAFGQNLLILFGANVSGQHGIELAIAYLHLAGVALALTGLLTGLACLVRDADRVTQILAVATLAILVAGALATPMVATSSAHEIAVVLPFSAVLAGRTVGSWLVRMRWRGPRLALPLLLAAALAGYVAALGYGVAQPALPAETQGLADWLVAHHLTGGLAKYWAANSTTLSAGGLRHRHAGVRQRVRFLRGRGPERLRQARARVPGQPVHHHGLGQEPAAHRALIGSGQVTGAERSAGSGMSRNRG
jgi:hypothetical protein